MTTNTTYESRRTDVGSIYRHLEPFHLPVQFVELRADPKFAHMDGKCEDWYYLRLLADETIYHGLADDDILIFAHGHEKAWHYKTPLGEQLERLMKSSYFSEQEFGGVYPWPWVGMPAQPCPNNALMMLAPCPCGDRRTYLPTARVPCASVYVLTSMAAARHRLPSSQNEEFSFKGLVDALGPLGIVQLPEAIQTIWRHVFWNTTIATAMDKIPADVSYPCCATFFVKGRAIRRRPQEDYRQIVRNLRWLVHNEPWLHEFRYSSHVMESSWATVFTGNPVIPRVPTVFSGTS